MARKLSQSRLAQLHLEMRKLRALTAREGTQNVIGFAGNDIPKEFKDLNCMSISPCDLRPSIMLEGCFDHGMFLCFYGIGESGESGSLPKITLQYGTFREIEEILWKYDTSPKESGGRE